MRIQIAAFPLLAAVAAAWTGTWSAAVSIDDPEGMYDLWEETVLQDGGVVLAITGAFEDPLLVCLDSYGNLRWHGHVLESRGMSRELENCSGIIPVEDG